MDSQFCKTWQWRCAAPQARAARSARPARVKSLFAFLMDQMLLFWPPKRYDDDCHACPPDKPANDQDEPRD